MPDGRIPPQLRLCRGCRQFVWPDTVTCPHCGGDVPALAARYAQTMGEAHDLAFQIEQAVLRLKALKNQEH